MSHQYVPAELGTEKISKLLRQYAMPAIIAMSATSLYNMVDSIFIGRGVGAMAISGFAVTFPFMNILAALGTLVGVGAGTLISVRFGQRDYGTAKRILGNVVIMNVVIGISFSILSLIFLDPILYFFGASEQTIIYARGFMEIILLGNVFTHLYFGLNNVLRASGHPKKAMVLTITTVVLNAVLAPIFIFVLKWGIKGTALATVLAQIVSLVWQVKIFCNRNELIHFSKRIFRPDVRIMKDMLYVGLSPFLMNLAACVIVILINNGFRKYGGDFAVGAYGIVNRIVFLFVMIVMGINQGMQPIVGYNYGARQMDRVQEVLKLTVIFATVITTITFIIGEFFPEQASRIFTPDDELVRLAVYGLRITVMFFPLIGAQIVITNFFQSMGMAGKAIFLSLIRQVLILIPCLIILPRFLGVTGVWVSLPVADIIAAAVSTVMIFIQLRKFKTEQI
jgi:putative MATE family efflux protein